MNQLRQCMRITGVTQAQIEELVLALSGHGLSVRKVAQLAHGCFRGPESLRQEILKGNFTLPLQQIKQAAQSCQECSDFERILLDDLETTQKYMQRAMAKSLEQQYGKNGNSFSQSYRTQRRLGMRNTETRIFKAIRIFTQGMGTTNDVYPPSPVVGMGARIPLSQHLGKSVQSASVDLSWSNATGQYFAVDYTTNLANGFIGGPSNILSRPQPTPSPFPPPTAAIFGG